MTPIAWIRPLFAAVLLIGPAVMSGCVLVVDENDCFGRPEVAYRIEDTVLILGEEILVLDLIEAEIFYHPDGARLSYDAASSDRRVARAYVRDGYLHVEPYEPGTTRIEVRASDRCRGRAYTSFRVRVVY